VRIPDTVIFDLDGTLTDPFLGITRSIGHALDQLGIRSPEPEALGHWIGPPLRLTFRALLETEDEELVEQAVAAYRERYFDIGYLENVLYQGVAEMLQSLEVAGARLFVVTSKVEPLARMIMKHFELDRHFAGIYGTEAGGRLDDKADLLKEVIVRESIDPRRAVMVGDTRFDMIAAAASGMRGIGVTYGYGSSEDLLRSGAEILCGRPLELIPRLEELERTTTLEPGTSR
jgi:phosphoglycolate phosphatase